MFLIAKEFSKLTGFEVENKLIKKIKHTKPQYKAKNRQKNIKDSFEINQKLIEKYKDKNLLLLDDITTSGSTLNEILDCLLNSNIKNITCLTISKAIKQKNNKINRPVYNLCKNIFLFPQITFQ